MHTYFATFWRSCAQRPLHTAFIALAMLGGACKASDDEAKDSGKKGGGSGGSNGLSRGGDDGTPPPPFAPSTPVLARLTQPQYENVIRDLFGPGIPSHDLEGDSRPYLFSVIGAATTPVSELGVDQYGRAAYDIAATAFATKQIDCAATPPLTDACLTSYIQDFGLRAWRRPLDAAEVERYKTLGTSIGVAEPMVTLEFLTAAMLQSPNFLYRVELGEPDAEHAGWFHYTNYEIASRLSFLLRNSMPDDELFAAAGRGELVTRDGVLAQATRLLSDANATKDMIAKLYTEYLDLPALFDVAFPTEIDADHSLALSMQTELTTLVNRVALDEGGDMRTLFNTRTTTVDANLATFYGFTAPAPGGLIGAEFPVDGPRAGLLTLGAVTALNSRPNRTAPTLRGFFVRERLLCGTVPPPPPNIPPISEETGAVPQTLREKLEQHRADPQCSGCHDLMDPIGLGMEDFDQFGRFRTVDANGVAVDDTGDLDGTAFTGTRALGEMLAADPRTMSCLVTQLYRYASARIETPEERIVLAGLDAAFAAGGYTLKPLILELVGSDGFRYLKSEAP